MNFERQFLVITLSFIIVFFNLRIIIHGIKRCALNTSARRKRQEGETFLEKMLYTRFRDAIPTSMLILYFFVISFHLLFLVICSFIRIFEINTILGEILARITYYIDGVIGIVFTVRFCGSGDKMISRVYKRKRGQKPKRKK